MALDTSSSFNDNDMANFLDTILDFLKEKPQHVLTKEAQNYHEIYLTLLDNLDKIKEIKMEAYYCCLGEWNSTNSCAVTLELKKQALVQTRIFEQVKIEPIGKANLLDLYKKASDPIQAEFVLDKNISIDSIQNVTEAYVGLITFKEFRKLIIDPNNGKLKNLFYDNVRDFLGFNNSVNEKIKNTLMEKRFLEFSLLNNGITVIADENTGRANNFILHNYQIVNGCQTSNVLYEAKDIDGIDNTLISIKVIITEDETLRDKIILSTNSQSTIKEEELLALTEFQKGLEEFYASAADGLYYERRNNQYATQQVKKKSIVDIREQIKAFVAMFLEEPHEVSGNFGKVYQQRKDQIFIKGHFYEPYYIAGLIQYRFKDFINTQEIDRKYNKARYHIFMLFRMIVETEIFNSSFLNARKKKSYFREILDIVKNEQKCLDNFKKVFSIIDQSKIDITNQREIYKKSTTTTLIETFKTNKQKRSSKKLNNKS